MSRKPKVRRCRDCNHPLAEYELTQCVDCATLVGEIPLEQPDDPGEPGDQEQLDYPTQEELDQDAERRARWLEELR